VAVVQYTFTHKQYVEQHNRHNTQINTTNWEDCGRCPIFASYTLAFVLQLRKKARKNLSQPKNASWHDENRIYRAYITIRYINITIRIHKLQNSTKLYKTYNHIHNDKKKKNQENMKEYDKWKSHIKLPVIYISSDNARHPVTKTHYTPLHYTFRHFTSSHLTFT